MASSKNNGVAGKKTDHDEDEILIEPIHIDSESLKRAVEEKARLQSQDSVKDSGAHDDRNKKTNNFKVIYIKVFYIIQCARELMS